MEIQLQRNQGIYPIFENSFGSISFLSIKRSVRSKLPIQYQVVDDDFFILESSLPDFNDSL